MLRFLAIMAGVALLASCTSGRPAKMPQAQYERLLKDAPGQANPSAVVAAELAFARMARENGQWTAFSHYAAPGAVLHLRNGPIEAAPWLAKQANPEQAVQWAPRELWSSCDGGTVISSGRFADPDRTFGYFVTVWERQGDGEYRYVYDFGWPDAELTAAERARLDRESAEPEGGILVEASSMIKADIADCPKGAAIPPRETEDISAGATTGTHLSRDGTLAWRWRQHSDGTRAFVSEYLHDGEWTEALVRSIPASGE